MKVTEERQRKKKENSPRPSLRRSAARAPKSPRTTQIISPHTESTLRRRRNDNGRVVLEHPTHVVKLERKSKETDVASSSSDDEDPAAVDLYPPETRRDRIRTFVVWTGLD